MGFDLDEVEAAFRNYWQLGAVGEDWDAWCDELLHRRRDVRRARSRQQERAARQCGRGSSRRWRSTARSTPRTSGTWSSDDGRVVVYMQNRRDNPEPGAPPIDFPGVTVLQYAGDGKFSLEEDFWSLPEGIDTLKQYTAACKQFDPDHPQQADASQLGQRPGLDAGRADLRRIRGAKGARSHARDAADAGARRAPRRVARRRDASRGTSRSASRGLKTYDPPPGGR